jgi:hypothetical protein
MERVKIASAGFIVIIHNLKKKERKITKRHWMTPVLKSRHLYGGTFKLLNNN